MGSDVDLLMFDEKSNRMAKWSGERFWILLNIAGEEIT